MLGDWPLWVDIVVFIAATGVIAVAGTKMAGLADRFADRTGLGEAITGTVFLGAVTALPGLTASVTAAIEGRPALAISNAMGGIAVQTAFLAVADIVYRKANLEHAAASALNMLQTAVLVLLLTLVLLGLTGPAVTIGHVHPMTIVLVLAAAGGFVLVYRTREKPMWIPQRTRETVRDEPAAGSEHESLARLVIGMAIAAVAVLASGAAVAHAAGSIVGATGISESLMGGLFTAVATSLPEGVTTIAAVRRGALTLAVSDIVGGNFFDVLFVSVADLFYLRGSLYHGEAISGRESFLTGITILMNVMLLVGLLYRQKHGVGNIGFESVLMLVIYIGGLGVVYWM